jgi:hypothetical protein
MLALIFLLIYSQRKWSVSLLDRMGLFVFLLGLYAQIFNYTATSYINTRSWYWIGQMLFTIICFGILLECIRLFVERIRLKPWLWQAVMAVFMAWVIFLYGQTMRIYFPYKIAADQQERYLAGIIALENATEPGAVIGSTGGGGISYFIKDRTVINMDGLINSNAYFQALKNGRGAAFLDEMKVNYVYGNEYVLTQTDPYYKMLEGHLDQEVVVTGTAVLYRYLPTP